MSEKSQSLRQSIPPDDPLRELAIPDEKSLHLGVVGDTYTILLTGKDTAGRFCLIDMHVPPGGGPPPHRHDFEETFSILEGELEVTFRGSSEWCKPVQRSTFLPMRRISFTIHPPIRRECFASVRQLARRNSFSRSALRLQPAQCLHPNLMKRHKQSSEPRSKRLLPSIGRNCSKGHERKLHGQPTAPGIQYAGAAGRNCNRKPRHASKRTFVMQ